ncbi:MAG: hypothetical protein ACI9C1_001959 [Candidatus Aldehydirespiratoraceae bacterium]|jgi:hypothetical protein
MPDLPTSDDELLSSALDGELSASDQATLNERLATEPALAERYALLSQAEALAATPVTPLSGADRDRLINVALAASTTAGNVTDLAAAGARRSAWRNRGLTIAAAAAALVLAVPAFVAINNANDGDYDTAATSLSADSAADDSADTSASSEEMALESAAAEMPLSDDPPADFDAAEDEMPVEEYMAGSDGGVNAIPVEGFAYDLNQNGLLQLSDFEGLDGLERSYSSPTELKSEVVLRWFGYVENAVENAVENEPDDIAAVTRSLLAVETALVTANLGGCPDVLLTLDGLDYGDTVTSVSFADTNIQGEAVTVAVVQVEDGNASFVLIDQNSCEVTFEGALP